MAGTKSKNKHSFCTFVALKKYLEKLEIQQAIITNINGSSEFKAFLLAHNITLGTVFSFNYSPQFAQLINLTIANRMLSMRKSDFQQIEWVQLR